MAIRAGIKKIAKKLHALSPVAFSRNEQYDRLTRKVIKKVCAHNSSCIDIGAHEGKILKWMIAAAPEAMHYAFEPIPELYHRLHQRFRKNALVFNIALSNTRSVSNFNLVLSNYAYSGLKKRSYDKPETDTTIVVNTDLLDNTIAHKTAIALIKMDVEGAELLVLQGAKKIIENDKPIILFECGKTGGDLYGFSAKDVFDILTQAHHYKLYRLQDWLQKKEALEFESFSRLFETGQEFFFLAAPSGTD